MNGEVLNQTAEPWFANYGHPNTRLTDGLDIRHRVRRSAPRSGFGANCGRCLPCSVKNLRTTFARTGLAETAGREGPFGLTWTFQPLTAANSAAGPISVIKQPPAAAPLRA